MLRRVFVLAVSLTAILAGAARATVPAGFTETLVAGTVSSPTAMAFAPDGRIFVTQQGGSLRVIENGSLLAAPFVSLSADSAGERGLLGVAFDPNFAANHFVYLYYTVPGSPPHNRVSRFTASGNLAVAGSELPILDLDNLSAATNHNGGAIHFGPDGKLYVAVGENANPANSQTLGNRLGKLLRISSDGSIPTDNPFFNTATGQNRAIWALGLRNPFTFAFQPGAGGRMFVNDVGNTTCEEIDEGGAGRNYGWAPDCPRNTSPFIDPLYCYTHGQTVTGCDTESGSCAITGGAFYNPMTPQFGAAYVGDYFFADLCGGWIHRLDLSSAAPTAIPFASGLSNPVDLHVSDDGSLYYLVRGGSTGAVYRISLTPTAVLAHSLTARARPGGIRLGWQAAGDPRLLGFNVYRGPAGRGVRLNRTLLPSGANMFVDRSRLSARAVRRYRLQVVLVDGTRRSYRFPVTR